MAYLGVNNETLRSVQINSSKERSLLTPRFLSSSQPEMFKSYLLTELPFGEMFVVMSMENEKLHSKESPFEELKAQYI